VGIVLAVTTDHLQSKQEDQRVPNILGVQMADQP